MRSRLASCSQTSTCLYVLDAGIQTACYDARPLCDFIENIFYTFSVIVSFYSHSLQVRSFFGILLSLHIYFRISQLTSTLSSKPRVSMFLWSIPLVRLSTKVYVWLIEFCPLSMGTHPPLCQRQRQLGGELALCPDLGASLICKPFTEHN